MVLKAPQYMRVRSTNSNPMTLSTPSLSRPSGTPNTERRIQREVLRSVPRQFIPMWGEYLGSGRGHYLTPNGSYELGIIYVENGQCTYRRLDPSHISSGPPSAPSSPVQQPMPLPFPSTAGPHDPHAHFPPTLHGHLLPFSPVAPQIEVHPPMGTIPHPHSHHVPQNAWEQHLYSQPGAHMTSPDYSTHHYPAADNTHGAFLGGMNPMDVQWPNSPHSTFTGSYGPASPSYMSASSTGWSPAPSYGPHESVYDDYSTSGGSYHEGPSSQH